MLRKIFIASIITVVSFAQVNEENNQSKELNIKTLIHESIDDIENKQQQSLGGWYIKDRKEDNNSESFIAGISVIEQDKLDEIYKDLEGLSFFNEIKYTKENISAISTLLTFPKNSHMSKKIIDDKVFVLHSNYNMNNFNYRIFLKDINLSIANEIQIETNNIQSSGHYNPNNIIDNKNIILFNKIKFSALSDTRSEEYIHVENFKVISEATANSENINIHFEISVGLVDIQIPENHSKIEKLNLSFSIGNLNLKTYMELVEYAQNHKEEVELSEEFQMLALELFSRSKDMYIEVSDLSLLNATIEGEETGPIKVNAKVSLKGTRELMQMMIINPQLALAALRMEAKIILHKDMLKKVYKEDKQAGAFLSLFAKYKNDNIMYHAIYKDGQLIINDQVFQPNQLGGVALKDRQLADVIHKSENTQIISKVSNVSPALSLESMNKNEDTKINSKPSEIIEKDLNSSVATEIKTLPEEKNKHMEKYGQNMLHKAVLSKKIEDVKELIVRKEFDINQADKLGRTPLHHAAFNGNVEIAKILLENGANINAVDKTKSWTPLFFAVFMKHKEMVDFLIEYGADTTRKDKLNRTIESYQK